MEGVSFCGWLTAHKQHAADDSLRSISIEAPGKFFSRRFKTVSAAEDAIASNSLELR